MRAYVWVSVGSAQRRKKHCSFARQTCAQASPCCRLTFCHHGEWSLILLSLAFCFLLLLFSIFFFFFFCLSNPFPPSMHYTSPILPLLLSCGYFKPIEGLLPESHWDSAQLCRGLEQLGLCVQCPGRDMAGHTPFWKGQLHSFFFCNIYQTILWDTLTV